MTNPGRNLTAIRLRLIAALVALAAGAAAIVVAVVLITDVLR